MTAVFHVHSHLLVGGGTSGHIGPLPGRDSDAARTHAATRGAGETRAAGLADLRLGYARPSADQTGHPTCRWPANFAVARQAPASPPCSCPIGFHRQVRWLTRKHFSRLPPSETRIQLAVFTAHAFPHRALAGGQT